MKKFLIFSVGLTAFAGLAQGANILTPGDFIIGIDVSQNPSSNHPAGEPPSAVLDAASNTKYLNFGEERSGLIVTPASGSSTVQSIVFTTAGDAEERDPASFSLYGTNDPIVSTNNSFGTLEGWSLITTSALALPSGRQVVAPAVGFLNGPHSLPTGSCSTP